MLWFQPVLPSVKRIFLRLVGYTVFTVAGEGKPALPPVAQPPMYCTTLSHMGSLLLSATLLSPVAVAPLSHRSVHSWRYWAPRVRDVVTL